MQITIKDQTIELKFGIRFVRELDSRFHVVLDGGKRVGTGLEETVPLLYTGNIIALSDVLAAASTAGDCKLTQDELDDYLDGVEDIDALFQEVLQELKNQNATKKRTLTLVADLEERAKAEALIRKTKKTLKSNTNG